MVGGGGEGVGMWVEELNSHLFNTHSLAPLILSTTPLKYRGNKNI